MGPSILGSAVQWQWLRKRPIRYCTAGCSLVLALASIVDMFETLLKKLLKDQGFQMPSALAKKLSWLHLKCWNGLQMIEKLLFPS